VGGLGGHLSLQGNAPVAFPPSLRLQLYQKRVHL
jgi:hypothetical protein